MKLQLTAEFLWKLSYITCQFQSEFWKSYEKFEEYVLVKNLKDFDQNSGNLMENLKNFDQNTGKIFERFRSEF